jgi:hypothetical protein
MVAKHDDLITADDSAEAIMVGTPEKEANQDDGHRERVVDSLR